MPIIPSLILTGKSPVISYTASVVLSGSVISDGLGNQITSLQLTSSYSTTSSFAMNGGGSGVSASYAETASFASTYNVITQSITQSVISSSYADFAPVLFSNVRIIDGNLIIKSSDTGNWFKLDVYDDGSGSFTTQLTEATATGSITNSSSYQAGFEYIQLVYPHIFTPSASAITNPTSSLFGHAVFNATANSSSNYVEYLFDVPDNLDTTKIVDGRLKFTIISTDTASYTHKLSMVSISSGSLNSTTSSLNEVSFTNVVTASTNTIIASSWTTLTGWSASLTPGDMWKIRLARDGSDQSISQSADAILNIRYSKV